MNNAATITKYFDNYAAEIMQDTRRDKYGRTVHHMSLNSEGQVRNTRVVIVRMPKVYIERYGKDQTFLINNWQHPQYIDGVVQDEATGKIVYAKTIKQAIEIAVEMIRNPHPLVHLSSAGR